MTIDVYETQPYLAQVQKIISPIQQHAVCSLLNDDPFAGQEVNIGKQDLFILHWGQNVKILYSLRVVPTGIEIYLRSISSENPPPQPVPSTHGVRKQSIPPWISQPLQKIGIGLSIKALWELAKEWIKNS